MVIQRRQVFLHFIQSELCVCPVRSLDVLADERDGYLALLMGEVYTYHTMFTQFIMDSNNNIIYAAQT